MKVKIQGDAGGFRNASFLIAEKVLQLASIAVVNIFVLRALGPVGYGHLSAATAILAIALPMANFGAQPIIRELSIRKGAEKALLTTAIAMSGVACLICFLTLSLVGRTVLADTQTGNVLTVLAFVFLAKPFAAVDTWFQAHHRNHITSSVRMVVLVGVSTARLYVAFYMPSVEALALLIVIENSVMAGALFACYLYFGKGLSLSHMSSLVPYKRLFDASWPLLVSGLAVILYMRIDQPMLLWLSGAETVGLYSSAANLADAVSFIPVMMSTVFLPRLMALQAKDVPLFEQRFERLLGIGAGLGYVAMIGGVALGPVVVQTLYGPAYKDAGLLVQILFISAPFVFLGVIQASYVLANNLQKRVLVITVFAIGLNVALNIYLIPILGAVGAAITTVMAHALGGVFGNLLFRETRVLFRLQMRALNPMRALQSVVSFALYRRL